MPFTFAHPAAVLPLRPLLGRYGVWSALIIGSMVPDLRLLSQGAIPRGVTHSASALLWFCLPAGLACFWMFHAWFREPLLKILPERVAARLPPARRWQWPDLLPISVSLLVGAGSHIVWDAFTHDDSPFTHQWPWLLHSLGRIGDYPLYGYRVLQHGSTAIGLIVLAAWLYARWREAPAQPRVAVMSPRMRQFWFGVTVLSALLGVTLALALYPTTITGVRSVLRIAKVTSLYAIAGALAALLVYCVVWQIGLWPRAGSGRDNGHRR